MPTDKLLIEVDRLFNDPEATYTNEDIQYLIKEGYALDFYRVLEGYSIEAMAKKEQIIQDHPDREPDIETVYYAAFNNYISPLITFIISYIEKNFPKQDTIHCNNHSCTNETSEGLLSTFRCCLSLLTSNIITQKIEKLTTPRHAFEIEAWMADWMVFIKKYSTEAERKEFLANHQSVLTQFQERDAQKKFEGSRKNLTLPRSVSFELSQSHTIHLHTPPTEKNQIPKSILRRSTIN